MNKPLQWMLGLAFAAAMGGNILWTLLALHKTEEKHEEHHEEARRLTRDEAGNSVLQVDAETQSRAAIRVETLKDSALADEIVAYGRFQEDPSRTFTLKAPAAGILRATPERPWPKLGDVVEDGTAVALLAPRFSPLERVDLQSKLATARAEAASASAALEAAKASADRLRSLNADNKTASDRAMQEAGARWKAEAARLQASTETVAALEASLGARTGTPGAEPLRLDRGGEVVELLGQPGEAVEAGQPILRVARYDRLLARLTLAPGEGNAGDPSVARIVALGREDAVLRGERLAQVSPDAALPGDSYLYGVVAEGLRLRPGMAFAAWLRRSADPVAGVVVPRAAVLRVEGERWVWIKTAADRFTRRELEHARPVEGGWFVAEGLKAGDSVVVAGPQLLLSEELKSKIQGED
jgi:hypothetical protein